MGLAIVIYGGVNWVLLPAYDRVSAAQDLASEKEIQLKRYRRASLRKGQYETLIKVADERLAKSEGIVIPAANTALASAEFQALIEGASNKVGLMLSQRMIGNPRKLNDFYAELPMTLG